MDDVVNDSLSFGKYLVSPNPLFPGLRVRAGEEERNNGGAY